VAKLIARTPAQEQLPLLVDDLQLHEVTGPNIFSLSISTKGLAEWNRTTKLAWPAQGRVTSNKDWRCLSFDHAHIFLIGPGKVPVFTEIAVTDQSDGWVWLRLVGPKATDVLARLVPLDLRPAAFPDDACAKTLLGHMPVLITRSAAGFDLLTFRSMAQTAIHELECAMKAVVARR